jgi:uncharacterized protein (DUF885 family)
LAAIVWRSPSPLTTFNVMTRLAFLLASVAIPQLAAAQSPANRLDSLAEAYYEELQPFSPVGATSTGDNRYNDRYVASFATSVRDAIHALNLRYLASLKTIPLDSLDAEHRITHQVFRYSLENAIEGHKYPSHLVPLNQFFSFVSSFAQLGAGGSIHPFRTVKDYDDFLSRMRGFENAVDTAIANMRLGMRSGIVQPKVLMERTLPQLAALITARADSSIFWGPVASMPSTFPEADRARLTTAYRERIGQGVIPAIRRLHDFVRNDYMPAARETAGLGALPGGRDWYAFLARSSTTTDMTPAEIHEVGLKEMARIHREMEGVKNQVGFKGTLQEFFKHLQDDPRYKFKSREEMLAAYREAQARIDPLTDRIFDVKPKATYEIRPVEPYRERSAARGSYMPASPDGSRPGVFYLNTYDPTNRARDRIESLLLHEGSPGHHFQITIQRELTGIPRIRRFGGYSAYSEGWGLYAESIGKELGVYQDPYQYFGALASELWRSIRLILDTGIHDKGWTREQAMAFGRANSSEPETVISAEVERFIAIPSQALTYKIGQLKITELRERAERELGPRFDVKAFHRAVLESGAMPMSVLEGKINAWIAARRG